MVRKSAKVRKKRGKSWLSLWLTSGMAQLMVLLNGLILTGTAFYILNIYVQEITQDEYKNASKEASNAFVERVTDLENTMRLISSILHVSKNSDRTVLTSQIKLNVPGLSNFDQLIWLYEARPGSWQYKTIYESNRVEDKKADFYIVPNQRLIKKIVGEKYFANAQLRVVSDFPGMNYIQTQAKPKTMERPFALAKVVTENKSSEGLILGLVTPKKLIEQKWSEDESALMSISIKDIATGKKLFNLTKESEEGHHVGYSEMLSYPVGDGTWQVDLHFTKDKNTQFMQQMPFIILFFGIALTAVGTLFVRNNQKQSFRMSRMNAALELKNQELHKEVSERERLNQALIKADKDNRAVIDSVSDIIFETDTDGNILFLSAAWQKTTGFDVDRSIGNNLFTMLHPDDQAKQKSDFQLLVKGQKMAYRAFTRIRTSDGTFRSVELAFSMIRQDENKDLRVVGTVTDVEERRRAERALSEAEKKYRTIVENAAGGLYQLTPEGIYLSANPSMARILGYESVEKLLREVKNANGAVYIDKDEREAFMNALIRAGQINGYETQVYRKDGSKIWVSENIRCVKDENDNILYFEGSMEDINQRKQAELALRDAKVQSDMANRAKTEFIANMSHELRTPLNAIIGFSEIMKNEVMGPLGADMYREYVSDIYDSGKGLLKIINEILDISKIESGNREINEAEIDFENVLKTCLDLNAGKMQDKRIILSNNAENLPMIIGEELSVKQIISNILSNAIKYTPDSGRITIFSTYDHNGSFRLSITDTGVGLTKEEIQKALSPFGQIDNALDRSGSGAGLGLTLSKSMMKLHGGDLEILSEKGIGTTVSLIFPETRVGQKKAKKKEEKGGSGKPPKNIENNVDQDDIDYGDQKPDVF